MSGVEDGCSVHNGGLVGGGGERKSGDEMLVGTKEVRV